MVQVGDGALEHLITNVGDHKVILCIEAAERYGDVAVDMALKKKYFVRVATPLGDALSLAHRGRRKVGLTGAYRPTVSAVSNALALRRVKEVLLEQGFEVQPFGRRSAVRARRHLEDFIALVRFTGYDHATIRRACDSLIGGGATAQLRVYVGREKVEALDKLVWLKKIDRAQITPECLKILALPER